VPSDDPSTLLRGAAAAESERDDHRVSRRRRLDNRSLFPRDYLLEPHRFGSDPDATTILPAGGDPVSLAVAVVQHRLACVIRARDDPNLARVVTRRFSFSKSFWSRCMLGQSWMGETVLAAAISVLLREAWPAHDHGRGPPR